MSLVLISRMYVSKQLRWKVLQIHYLELFFFQELLIKKIMIIILFLFLLEI